MTTYYAPSFGSSSLDEYDEDRDLFLRRQRFAERLQQLEDEKNIERTIVRIVLITSIAVAVIGTACAFIF